jgi:hypothetical protein
MPVGTCPNVLEYTRLPDPTPQRHAATVPGIKLSYLVYGFLFISIFKENSKNKSAQGEWFITGY